MKMEVKEIIGYDEETYDLMVKCPNEDCQKGVYFGSDYCPRCRVGLSYKEINKKVREYLGMEEQKYE